MSNVKFFLVGGFVRDEIMGVPSKDVDFTCVAPSFESMREVVVAHGMKVVQEKPEFFTIRAVARQPFMGFKGGLDFVWARKDGPSADGRRPDFVEPGSLMDDLSRRDFSCNAIAKAEDGTIIDPFDGQADIQSGVIRAVGNAEDRLREDALRGLRAIRFAITKDMEIHKEVRDVMTRGGFAEALLNVSKERQREEMEKAFEANTVRAMLMLHRFPAVMAVVFSDGLRLSATMKH